MFVFCLSRRKLIDTCLEICHTLATTRLFVCLLCLSFIRYKVCRFFSLTLRYVEFVSFDYNVSRNFRDNIPWYYP